MQDFNTWLKKRDPKLYREFLTMGHSEDWSDEKAANSRFNTPEYAVRGVRSKYIANMKSGNSKRKSKKKAK